MSEDNNNDDWRELMSEDIRSSDEFRDMKSIDDLAKQYIDRGKFLNGAIRIPSEDAGTEDMQAFHGRLMEKVPGLMLAPNPEDAESIRSFQKRIGLPEEASAYSHPENVPDQPGIREKAHELGLTNAQYKGFMEAMAQQAESNTEAEAAAHASNLFKLKQTWGLAYDDKTAQVSGLLEAMDAPPHIKDAFRENKLDVSMVQWFSNIADAMGAGQGEANTFTNEPQQTGMTPEEASSQIRDILNNRDHPYWTPSDPGYAAAQRKFLELNAAALGKKVPANGIIEE